MPPLIWDGIFGCNDVVTAPSVKGRVVTKEGISDMIRDERMMTCQMTCNSTEGSQAWVKYFSSNTLQHHFCSTGSTHLLPKHKQPASTKSKKITKAKADAKISRNFSVWFTPLSKSLFKRDSYNPNNPKSKYKDIGLIRDKDLNARARGNNFSPENLFFSFIVRKNFFSLGIVISPLLILKGGRLWRDAPETNLCGISSRHEIS
jgi:hypothetical protein